MQLLCIGSKIHGEFSDICYVVAAIGRQDVVLIREDCPRKYTWKDLLRKRDKYSIDMNTISISHSQIEKGLEESGK